MLKACVNESTCIRWHCCLQWFWLCQVFLIHEDQWTIIHWFFLFKLSDRLSDKLEGFTGQTEIYRKSPAVQHLSPSQLAHIIVIWGLYKFVQLNRGYSMVWIWNLFHKWDRIFYIFMSAKHEWKYYKVLSHKWNIFYIQGKPQHWIFYSLHFL